MIDRMWGLDTFALLCCAARFACLRSRCSMLWSLLRLDRLSGSCAHADSLSSSINHTRASTLLARGH